MSPGVSRNKETLDLDISNGKYLPVPQKFFPVVAMYHWKFIKAMDYPPPSFAGEVFIFLLPNIQRRIAEQPVAVRLHRTHMVGVLMSNKDVPDVGGI